MDASHVEGAPVFPCKPLDCQTIYFSGFLYASLLTLSFYIDKKMLPQMQTLNAVYRLAETSIKEYIDDTNPRDEIMLFLQSAVIDEDEYLRFRISERFNDIMKSLFEAHKKDALSPEHNETIEEMKDFVQSYMEDRKTQPETVAKFYKLCKQLQLNANRLTEEEQRVMMKALERSPHMTFGRGGSRKKKRK